MGTFLFKYIPSAVVELSSEKKSKFSEMENCQDLNKPEKIYLMYLLFRMYVIVYSKQFVK